MEVVGEVVGGNAVVVEVVVVVEVWVVGGATTLTVEGSVGNVYDSWNS